MTDKIVLLLDVNEIKAMLSIINYVIVEKPMSQVTKYSFELLRRKLEAELNKHYPVKQQ